jgi:hypothetical protein
MSRFVGFYNRLVSANEHMVAIINDEGENFQKENILGGEEIFR